MALKVWPVPVVILVPPVRIGPSPPASIISCEGFALGSGLFCSATIVFRYCLLEMGTIRDLEWPMTGLRGAPT